MLSEMRAARRKFQYRSRGKKWFIRDRQWKVIVCQCCRRSRGVVYCWVNTSLYIPCISWQRASSECSRAGSHPGSPGMQCSRAYCILSHYPPHYHQNPPVLSELGPSPSAPPQPHHRLHYPRCLHGPTASQTPSQPPTPQPTREPP